MLVVTIIVLTTVVGEGAAVTREVEGTEGVALTREVEGTELAGQSVVETFNEPFCFFSNELPVLEQ